MRKITIKKYSAIKALQQNRKSNITEAIVDNVDDNNIDNISEDNIKASTNEALKSNYSGIDIKYKNAINTPRNWSQLSYAGEYRVPQGIDPTAGSWYLYYMKHDGRGSFTTLDGKLITFSILDPSNIDFEAELKIVKETLKNLTMHQRVIAGYWGEGPATKQWTPIIDRLIDTYGLSPVYAARVLAVTQAGINDAFVITWYYKYLWDVLRPCQMDQNLRTEICTPKFPGYPSGHSVISGAAEVILSYFFPTEGERIKKLAEENGISRLYGGVHFPSDISEGLRLGRQIGEVVVEVIKHQQDLNQVTIDIVKTFDLHAKLNPPPYKQVIPYPPRVRSCSLPLLPDCLK